MLRSADIHCFSSQHYLLTDSTTTFEGLGLSLQPSEGIVNSKGLSDSEFELTDLKSRGLGSLLGRGEGGGRSGDEGGDSELHGCSVLCF